MSATQENRLIAMALNPRKRFRLTPRIKREMIEASRTNLQDEDGRVVNGAVANMIRMERLNQADEHKQLDKEKPDANVTNQQINIYLPANGREVPSEALTDGHATNV